MAQREGLNDQDIQETRPFLVLNQFDAAALCAVVVFQSSFYSLNWKPDATGVSSWLAFALSLVLAAAIILHGLRRARLLSASRRLHRDNIERLKKLRHLVTHELPADG